MGSYTYFLLHLIEEILSFSLLEILLFISLRKLYCDVMIYKSVITWHIIELHLKTESVPRSKHTTSRL